VTLIKDCPYVFSTTGKTPVSGFGKIKEHLNARILELIHNQSAATGKDSEKVEPLPEWRFHDLRRTAATHMGDILGFAPHVIGSVLNHDPKKYMGITHVYARSDLIAERRAALSAWARFVQLLTDDAKWTAVDAHLRANPSEDAESSYERREEFRRIIRADAKTWRLYVASLSARTGDNVSHCALRHPYLEG